MLCHQFRRDPQPQFFASRQPGPRTQPKKSAARELIVALRKQNHSVYEISEALKERNTTLSPTAVREVLREEGFAPLPRRLDEERPARLRPTVEPVADVREFVAGGTPLLDSLRRALSVRARFGPPATSDVWPRRLACRARQ